MKPPARTRFGTVTLATLLVAAAALAQVATPPPPGVTATPLPAAQDPMAKTPGMILVEEGKHEAALSQLEAELKEAPKRLDLHRARVKALMGLKRYLDARGAAMQGLFVDPMDGPLRTEMGRCSYQMGQMDQALQAWKPLLSNPDWRQVAVVWSSRALRAVGKETAAKQLVVEELATTPQPFSVLLHQAMLLDPSVENGPKYIDRLMAVDPANRSDYVGLKALYQQMGPGEVCQVALPGGTPAVIPLKEKSEVKNFNTLTWGSGWDARMSGGSRVVLPVQFPGTDGKREWMLLDSGSDNFLVSGYMVKKLGLQPVATAEYVGLGYKGPMPSNWVILKEIQVGPATLRNVPAMVIEKEDDFWKETAGILPLSVFRHYAIQFDRRKGNLTLHPTGTSPETLLGKTTLSAPFVWAGRNPFVQVRIEDSPPIFFLLDTGSESTFVDSKRASTYGLTINVKYGAQGITGMSGGVYSKVANDCFLQLGRARIAMRGVQITDLGEDRVLDCPGILGRDILDLFAIFIDYPANTLVFKPYDVK